MEARKAGTVFENKEYESKPYTTTTIESDTQHETSNEQIETLKIIQRLEQIITEEQTTAVFECIVEGSPRTTCTSWFKNGTLLEHDQRINITSNTFSKNVTCLAKTRTVHMLNINDISAADQGIYTFVCQNSSYQLTTKATLYVASKELTKGVCYNSSNGDGGIRVLEHLRNVNVEEGKPIKLQAIFEQATDSVFWFKNNEIIEPNNRIILIRSNGSETLILLNAQMTDIGIYYVVVRTPKGIVTSFADVHVTSVNESKKEDDLPLPSIVELPNELVTFKNDNVRVVCKAYFDINTSIEWHKNGIPITNNNRFLAEDYGCQYIGMRGINYTVADTGMYTLTLRDAIKKKEESQDFHINVTRNTKVRIPPVMVTRPLISAVACIGSKVVFDCSFALADATCFYMVWYIGHYRIERSNSKFSVICKDGECLLFIKKLEPDMAGTVVCELRKLLLNQNSVHAGSTTTTLVIVPSSILEEENSNDSNLMKRKTYYYSDFLHTGVVVKARKGVIHDFEDFTDDDFLDISCCRPLLDIISLPLEADWATLAQMGVGVFTYRFHHTGLNDKGLVFIHAVKDDKSVNAVWQETDDKSTDVISWDNSMFLDSCWFEISIGQSDDNYVDVGEVSSSVIWLRKPPLETLLKMRVRAIPRPNNATTSTITIGPHREDIGTPPKKKELHPMEKYQHKYIETGDSLGVGAFGSVRLVRDHNNKLYAAKIIRTGKQKSRDRAWREYVMMKKVHHPKLVELIGGFHDPSCFIIIMECLWGGELFDRVVQEENIMEQDVVNYVRQLCEALAYLHSQNIAHLDVKPENIICLNPNSCQVKLIDMGLAMVLDGHNSRTLYGTREYMAPELLNYDMLTLACDMWSVAVVTYVLISGLMPFGGEFDTWAQTSAKIITANYDYYDIVFEDISDLAKDFIDKLLLLNKDNRMSAKQALEHEWLVKGPPKGAKMGHMKRTRENMKTYLAAYRGKWQKAGHVILAAHRMRASAAASSIQREKETATVTTEKKLDKTPDKTS